MAKDSLGFIQGLQCWGGLCLQLLLLVLLLQFRHLLQTISLKAMCSQVLFHFYFSDVWFGSLSGLAFLYLNLLSLLARNKRNVQILEKDTLWQQSFFPVIGRAARPILDGEGLLFISGRSPPGVTPIFPFSVPVFHPCFCKGWENFF